MRHPYEKFIKMELLVIVCAGLFGLFALIQGYFFLIILCLYLIAFSQFLEAISYLHVRKTGEAGKQFIRAAMLVFFVTFIVFHL